MNNEIIIYEADKLTRIDVKLQNDTVWLSRQQIAELFNRDIKTIGKHINNAIKEELAGLATVAKFATVQKEGDRLVERQIEYYNLDIIISVGYRVKSKRGVEFRIWANRVLKDYLLKGYSLNKRMSQLENNMGNLVEKVNEIDLQINSTLPPKQGIFYDGQIFDAYLFVCDLVKSANKSIVLIDNFVDESVLALLAKRKARINADIFTKSITRILRQDLRTHNAQYPQVNVHTFTKSHDRFLIIDNEHVYHFGASLKDLGKKWFAFSRMNLDADEIIQKLRK